MLRHKRTGQLGYLEGKTVRLDRPSDPHARASYVEADWEKTEEHRPLSQMQTAEVLYITDSALSRYRGERPKPWIDLDNKAKQKFEELGPGGDPVRAKVFHTLKKLLTDGR